MLTQLIAWIIAHPYTDLSIIISVIEILLRLFPTSKNYSLLDKLHTLLNIILPNLKDKTAIEKARAEKIKIENYLNENKFKIK